ncbi:hypothetical protein H0H93_010196 [Arthromyces matolae]|nr:hypothetical protein H0H93_010196 [Arthromyces matolae]
MRSAAFDDMYNRHVAAIRHRPLFRNLLYATLFFSCIYLLNLTARSSGSTSSGSIEKFVIRPPQAWEETAAQVRRAFLHAYHGYERYAAPHDELLPLTDNMSDTFNGWGVTVFDSLDTMLIMDLKNEYARAVEIVKHIEFSLPDNPSDRREQGRYAPYFETVIRYLGGLLSAYALSKNQLFLDRADELAVKLDPVFNTTSGLASFGVNPTNQAISGPDIGILAEFASLQLEYIYLAKLTGKSEHFQRARTLAFESGDPNLTTFQAQTLSKVFGNADLRATGGMLPIKWNLTTGRTHNSLFSKIVDSRRSLTPGLAHVSVGAYADSAHEYLLKQYLMTAKTDRESLKMYLRTTTHIISNLLYLSPTRRLLYVTDEIIDPKSGKSSPSHVFEHLSCFLPGLLALGAHTLPLDDLESIGITLDDIDSSGMFGSARKNHETLKGYNLKKLHLWAAEGIAQTCYMTYADQPTGLGPDEMIFKAVKTKKTWDATVSQWRVSSNGLWMDAMESWKRSGSRGTPPGLENKKPVVHNKQTYSDLEEERDYELKRFAYLLRPETVESLYILWRVTGDIKWRERGWRIFAAIETHAKTSSGYASVRTVDLLPARLKDDQPSYFLAETLKYLYLLFIDEDPISLDKWVFNTEAHPLPIFEWTSRERELFGIP